MHARVMLGSSGSVGWKSCVAAQPSKPCRASQRERTTCASAASESQTAQDLLKKLQYQYNSSDGRPKATMEDAFRLDRRMQEKVPWQLSWQKNERNLVFDDPLKVQLIKGFAARELGIDDEVMDQRLRELSLLLPELRSKLSVMKPKTLALMAADTQALAIKLLALRDIFPRANIAQMVVRQPAIVVRDNAEQECRAAAQRLRELLPRVDIDGLVEQFPNMLNIKSVENALQAMKAAGLDVDQVMTRNPEKLFQFERRADMIPYDE